MTAETIIQSLASGLLMGLLYGLIAVGLALIFGLMDVVNFAHGEFLMIAMYAAFFLFAYLALDPLLAAPLVAAALFVFGAVVYLLVVRFAVRAKANAGMVQIFSTFGLAVALVGIDKNRVFALGWGLGAALVGLAGAVMAMFFYIYPDVGASFALIAYVTVALGGFGSVFGAFAGGIIVGLVEATTALVLPPSLKSVGIYAVYLLVVFIRPRGLFGSM